MKNFSKLFLLVLLSGAVFLSSCKKKKEEEEQLKQDEATLQTENESQSKDQSQVQTETKNAFDDANSAFSGTSAGKSTNAISICGATVDTASIASKIIFINYDSTTTCTGYKKSGKIKVQLISGTSWRNAGATVQLTYLDYKVTKIATNKSIVINGVQNVTKQNTIDWITFLTSGTGSVSYKTRANNMSITFDDGSTRTWSAAHTSSYSVASGVVTASHSGDTTITGISSVSHWGTNRFGKTFTTAISSSIVSNNTCGWWKPISGVVSHLVNSKSFTTTFGVASDGVPVSSGCAFGFKVDWTGVDGTAKQAIVSY